MVCVDSEGGIMIDLSNEELSSFYCVRCGGFIKYDTSLALCSSPPKYKGKCVECGEVKYAKCEVVNKVLKS